MIEKYIPITLMTLIIGVIIFSLIYSILLRTNNRKTVFKIKIKFRTPIMEVLDQYLRRGGYWISFELWIFVQLIILVAACIYGSSYYGLFEAAKNAIGLYGLLQLLLYLLGVMEIKKRNQRITMDLCRLQETLYFQGGTGVEREEILLAVYGELKDPELKKTIKNIIYAYSLKQDVIEEISKLKLISNNSNLSVFANILIQDFKVGEVSENIEAQATVTRRLTSNRLVIERRASRVRTMIVSFFIALMLMTLITVPIILDFKNSMNRLIG